MVAGQKSCCNHGRKRGIDEIARSVVGAGHVRHGQPTGNGVVANEQLLGLVADEAGGCLCGYVVERAEEGVAKGNGDDATADVELKLGIHHATNWGVVSLILEMQRETRREERGRGCVGTA